MPNPPPPPTREEATPIRAPSMGTRASATILGVAALLTIAISVYGVRLGLNTAIMEAAGSSDLTIIAQTSDPSASYAYKMCFAAVVRDPRATIPICERESERGWAHPPTRSHGVHAEAVAAVNGGE